MSNFSQMLFTGQYSGNVISSNKSNGLITGITSYTNNNFNSEFHYHANHHLSMMLQGGNIENRKSGRIERKVGELVFYNAGELHQTLPATTLSKNINLEIEQSFLERYEISENELNHASANAQNALLFVKIYKELLTKDDLSDTSIEMLLINIIYSSQKTLFKKPQWALKLAEVLNDQWDQPLSLSYLASITGVHPVTISKYFVKYFGCTLSEYLRRLKVHRSIPLIKSNKHSLIYIALACGFADQSHFIRNFKAYTGFLPKDFQKL